MNSIKLLLQQLDEEVVKTLKMFSRLPDDKFDWQPHPKSMTIRKLAGHIAELPGWVTIAVNTDELDFATANYKTPEVNSAADTLELLEQTYADGRAHLVNATEDLLDKSWVLRNGDYIISTRTKRDTVLVAIDQTIHHRAQLGVYLRLLDIPVPGSYGPSADEMQVS